MTTPEPTPGSPTTPRLGPRPLAMHLMMAHAVWLSSIVALPLLRSGSTSWKLIGPLDALRDDLEKAPADALCRAIADEVRRRSGRMLDGIEVYRRHDYRRSLGDPRILWREHETRLVDYGPPDGRPILFVPSLVNRGYILDLSPRRSLLRWLAEHGMRPLLVDWGRPGTLARRYTLTDYIAGRLDRALNAALTIVGGPIPAAGYCMGGTLLAALAQRRAEDLSALVMLATPWDFHAEDADRVHRQATAVAAMLAWVEQWGELPVDALQALFSSLDPLLVAKKFAKFAGLDPASDKAEAFVALEDWLNDGVPLAGPVAKECLAGWYGDNTPARGHWQIAGEPVDPACLHQPSLHLIPSQDRIVPPASARALAAAMPNAEVLQPPLGHIGMMVGGGAERHVWRPLADWLAAQA